MSGGNMGAAGVATLCGHLTDAALKAVEGCKVPGLRWAVGMTGDDYANGQATLAFWADAEINGEPHLLATKSYALSSDLVGGFVMANKAICARAVGAVVELIGAYDALELAAAERKAQTLETHEIN